MTAREPLCREPCALERAVLGERLAGVFGTRRIKPARRRQQRREQFLINPNQKNQQRFHGSIGLQKKLATKREPQRKKLF